MQLSSTLRAGRIVSQVRRPPPGSSGKSGPRICWPTSPYTGRLPAGHLRDDPPSPYRRPSRYQSGWGAWQRVSVALVRLRVRAGDGSGRPSVENERKHPHRTIALWPRRPARQRPPRGPGLRAGTVLLLVGTPLTARGRSSRGEAPLRPPGRGRGPPLDGRMPRFCSTRPLYAYPRRWGGRPGWTGS